MALIARVGLRPVVFTVRAPASPRAPAPGPRQAAEAGREDSAGSAREQRCVVQVG